MVKTPPEPCLGVNCIFFEIKKGKLYWRNGVLFLIDLNHQNMVLYDPINDSDRKRWNIKNHLSASLLGEFLYGLRVLLGGFLAGSGGPQRQTMKIRVKSLRINFLESQDWPAPRAPVGAHFCARPNFSRSSQPSLAGTRPGQLAQYWRALA